MSNARETNESNETGDLIFDTLWTRVLESWDDDKTHAAILDYALRSERLPDLAGAYRALENDPERGERAKKQLNALVGAATALLMAKKTPELKKAPWQMTATVGVLCLLVIAWVALKVLRFR